MESGAVKLGIVADRSVFMTDTLSFSKIVFHRDDWGQLVVTLSDGSSVTGVEAIRCFPHSDPTHAIAIVDELGREILNIPSLDLLSPASREIVASDLAERDFVPVIRRIISSSPPQPPCIWEVETDRGRTQFQLESED
ncbi:MAG: DUF1854 domain-containing protein, partial [Planctomycetes bacterium]|nr:DUF1854 domain-containing protein [Planctomycetota bacterium]